jgi:hypothetical protein
MGPPLGIPIKLKIHKMKKSIFSFLLPAMIGISTAFAEKGPELNPAVSAAFSKDFANGRAFKWEKQKDFDKVTFSLDGQVLFAYYKENGELLAVVRNILSCELPIHLMFQLRKDYGAYWISNLFEMASAGKTHYFITLENVDGELILVSDSDDVWSGYEKSTQDLF